MWWRTIMQSHVTLHLEGTLSCLSTTGVNQNHFMMFFSSLKMHQRWHFIIFSPLEGHFHCIFFLNMGAPWGVSLPLSVALTPENQTFSVSKLASAPLQKCLVSIRLSGMGEGSRSLSLSLHTQYMFDCVAASSSGFRVWGWTFFLPLLFTFSWFVLSSFPRIPLRSSWFAARL